MDNPVFATASELATALRERRVSAVELLDAHLAHIARHNPVLNAIVTLDEERARARAREAGAALAQGTLWGLLHGVPVTIEDTLGTAGVRTTSGFPPLADHVPATDATVVTRLRTAGAIILGKTNLPPLAGGIQVDNPHLRTDQQSLGSDTHARRLHRQWPDAREPMPVQGVQIWSDGTITCHGCEQPVASAQAAPHAQSSCQPAENTNRRT